MKKYTRIIFACSLLMISGLTLKNPPRVFATGPTPIEIPLHYSATITNTGGWLTFYYTPTFPSGVHNFVGLSGNITVSGNSNNDGLILIALINDVTGVCPPTGQYRAGIFYPFPNYQMLASYIIKINQPGSVTVPTQYILPVKPPVLGCISLMINGGEPKHGDPITTTSTMNFLYDTDTAPSPSPYVVNLGAEFCIGRRPGVGCTIAAQTAPVQQAFAQVSQIAKPSLLWSLNGDLGTAANRILTDTPCPSGTWTTTANFYVYPKNSCPPTGVSGPSVQLAQIPAGATKLTSATINGNRCVGNLQSINTNFSPPVNLQAGDCLVQTQQFDGTWGALAAETQVTALIQPIPSGVPSPTHAPTPTPTPTLKPGDLNGDGKVDIFDYNLLVANFGKTGTPGFTPADIDKNGKVDIFDYNILVGNFGK